MLYDSTPHTHTPTHTHTHTHSHTPTHSQSAVLNVDHIRGIHFLQIKMIFSINEVR